MLNNFSMKQKLITLSSFLLAISLMVGLIGLRGTNSINDSADRLYEKELLGLSHIKEANINLIYMQRALRNVLLAQSDTRIDQNDYKNKFTQFRKTLKSELDQARPLFYSDEGKMKFAEMEAAFSEYEIVVDKIFKMSEAEEAKGVVVANRESVFFTLTVAAPITQKADDLMTELAKMKEENAKKTADNTTEIYNFAKWQIVVLVLFGMVIGGIVTWFVIRQIMKELGGEPSYAASVVNEVANGNLSVKVNLLEGDNSSLLYSINQMSMMLQSVIKDTNSVMGNAENGKLSSRIRAEVKGDFNHLKDAINKSLNNVEETLADVVRVVNALANGDLSQKITGEYHGAFGQTKDSVNQTVDVLGKLIEEIDSIVYSGADCGDFSVKMSMHDKVGYGKRLAELINQLFGTTEKSLTDVLRVAEALAKGDLTQSIEDDYVGAFAAVKVGINSTVENLKNLIGEIQETSEVIASSSNEISAGNNDLSHRTEEQAASLQQTAASMEELSIAVQQNTDNAGQANQLAEGASTTAKKGVKVVNDVVKTMATINESSHKIVDIITVIDDIAFQTNILALNAAVEAARAGDSGKGFAVVAIEVRNLAQRAANAAGEIKRLIDNSVDDISSGSKQVAQAGKTMEDIVGAIQNVTVIMAGIAAASIQQNEGINQVHQAVTHMDTVTQQNAALVEEVAAAAESLSEQTRNLATGMARFKTW